MALIIEFTLFATFAHWLECLIHNNAKAALGAYTAERLSVQLILNIIILCILRTTCLSVLKLMRAPWVQFDR